MKEFLHFCGFLFAHAVWSISDGSILIAFGGKSNSNKQKEMTKFVNEENYEKSVESAKEFLEKESITNEYTAIYFDGYYRFPNDEKTDTIFMIARFNNNNKIIEITIALPYRKKSLLKSLKIYKPKIVNLNGITENEIINNYDYFWNGIDSHEKGSKTWNKSIDQSK